MSRFTRVYHPTLDSCQDVLASAVDEWVAAGWLTEQPAHFNPDNARRHPAFDEGVVESVVDEPELDDEDDDDD